MSSGDVYIVHGDIARCQADALVFSTSTTLLGDGELFSSFHQKDGFTQWYAALAKDQARDIGETDWLAPRGKEPGVVLVRSVGKDNPVDPGPHAAAMLRRALRRAVDELGAKGQRRLVLVPALLTGRGGGHAQRLEVAKRLIEEAYRFVGEEPQVDVAFVLFTPSTHALYRHARRELGRAPSSVALAAAAPLRNAIQDRECVLFVGAGVSAGAGMPSWNALVQDLAARAALPCPDTLSTQEKLAIAEEYRRRSAVGSVAPVMEVVAQHFGTPTAPTLMHYLLAQLDCRYVFTTNYDRLLEHTVELVKRPWLRVSHARDVPSTSRLDATHVVKLHGDALPAGQLPSNDAYGDVVLSTADYEHFTEERAAFDLLLGGLMLNHTFLFVGYSLSDPNVVYTWERILGFINGRSREAGYARRAFGLAFSNEEAQLAGLDWISNAGTDLGSRAREQRRALDALAEYVVNPAQMLARDAESGTDMSPVREALAEAAAALEKALAKDASRPPDETAALAVIATSLYALGWRHGTGRPSLWEKLALAARERPDEQRHLLERALLQATSQEEVTRLRETLQPAPESHT